MHLLQLISLHVKQQVSQASLLHHHRDIHFLHTEAYNAFQINFYLYEDKFVFHKSWDHMWFPIPFSKAVIICGEPIEFDGDLQRSLQTLKNQAQEFFLF